VERKAKTSLVLAPAFMMEWSHRAERAHFSCWPGFSSPDRPFLSQLFLARHRLFLNRIFLAPAPAFLTRAPEGAPRPQGSRGA
jgi:hypothetical protein